MKGTAVRSKAVRKEAMKKEDIGAMLKKHRKLNNLSVKQAAERLKDLNIFVAPKTIYGWESGNTQPDANTLLSLCDLYHIDKVLEECGYHVKEKEDFSPTDTEIELIKAYRKHPSMHEPIHKLLDLDL